MKLICPKCSTNKEPLHTVAYALCKECEFSGKISLFILKRKFWENMMINVMATLRGAVR